MRCEIAATLIPRAFIGCGNAKDDINLTFRSGVGMGRRERALIRSNAVYLLIFFKENVTTSAL